MNIGTFVGVLIALALVMIFGSVVIPAPGRMPGIVQTAR